jgi:acyl carrier protein
VPRRRLVAAGQTSDAGLPTILAGLAPAARRRMLLTLVRTHAAEVLGHAGMEAITPDRSFKDLGFDSLSAVNLRNRLATAAGVRLPATLAFDHPSPVALAEWLAGELAPGGPVVDTGDVDLDEARIAQLRHALATVPIDRFRELGVLDHLVSLIGRIPAAVPDPGTDIADLSVEDLIARALGADAGGSGQEFGEE